MVNTEDDGSNANIEVYELKLKELRILLDEEVEKRKKAEKEYELLKGDFEAKLDEKLRMLKILQAQQASLNDNLIETTVLIEKIHERFAGAVEELEEGMRAKAYEFEHVSDHKQEYDGQFGSQSLLLDRLNNVLYKLQESKQQIKLTVGELKKAVRERTKQAQVSEDRYKSIFKRVKDGIFIIDSGWNITDVNPAMCEMLGYKYRRLTMDLNIRDDVFADEYDFDIFEKEVIVSGFIRNDETKFRTGSGSEIDVIVSCTAIWSEEDVLIGYEGIVRDITEHKKMQEQRAKMQRLEAVNNMVITINHNMNQNLMVINNYCQILEEEFELDPVLGNYIENISTEVENLIELVSKISRIRDIHTTEYVDGVLMIDLEKSIQET